MKILDYPAGWFVTGIAALMLAVWPVRAGASGESKMAIPSVPQGHPRVYVRPDDLPAIRAKLKDPAFADKMVRFVRASMKGWKWAEEHPDEAAMIVLENDATGAQTEKHQKRMMREIAKLTAGSNGTLDEGDYNRTVDSRMKGGSDPVITKVPQGAWTHQISDKALK